MKISRLFTGSDGQSHFEELPISAHPDLTGLSEAAFITFRETPAGRFQDWHPAPRRQWVITLKGELEIGLGDGSLWKFGPGDARLVEDTTGQGHTTRVGTESSICAYIHLRDQ
jgi:hypothetical protein